MEVDEGKRSRCIICNCFTHTNQSYNIFTTQMDGEINLSTFLKNVLDCSVLIIVPPDFFICKRCFKLCSELEYSLERCNKLQLKIQSLFKISKANQEAYYNGGEPIEIKCEPNEDDEIIYKRERDDNYIDEEYVDGEYVDGEYIDGEYVDEEQTDGNQIKGENEGPVDIHTFLETHLDETSGIFTTYQTKDDCKDDSELIEDGIFWPPNEEYTFEDASQPEMETIVDASTTEDGTDTTTGASNEGPQEIQETSLSTEIRLSNKGAIKRNSSLPDPLGTVWYCKPCKVKFSSFERLKKHKKNENCKSHCKNFEIKSAYEYKNYTIKLKHRQKVFFCNYCTFEAANSETMDKHVISHKTDPYIMCEICGRRYKSNRTFKKHLRTHDESRPFGCKFCTFRSATEITLKIHQRIHEDQKKYSCSKCSYKSIKKLSYQNHLRTHTGERPYCCPDCPYRAKDSSTLIRHRRIHGGLKRYHCTNCDYKSVQKNALKRHMMIHTGEKPHSCPLCDYSSTMKCNLADHIAAKHSTEKPYECDLCDYKSKAKRLLNYHMRIHSNERPFACNLCDFRGRHRGSLSYHMKSRHPPDGVPKRTRPIKYVHLPAKPIEFSDEEEDVADDGKEVVEESVIEEGEIIEEVVVGEEMGEEMQILLEEVVEGNENDDDDDDDSYQILILETDD